MDVQAHDPNALSLPFVEALYADYLRDPASVDSAWRTWFETLPDGSASGIGPSFEARSLFHATAGPSASSRRHRDDNHLLRPGRTDTHDGGVHDVGQFRDGMFDSDRSDRTVCGRHDMPDTALDPESTRIVDVADIPAPVPPGRLGCFVLGLPEIFVPVPHVSGLYADLSDDAALFREWLREPAIRIERAYLHPDTVDGMPDTDAIAVWNGIHLGKADVGDGEYLGHAIWAMQLCLWHQIADHPQKCRRDGRPGRHQYTNLHQRRYLERRHLRCRRNDTAQRSGRCEHEGCVDRSGGICEGSCCEAPG